MNQIIFDYVCDQADKQSVEGLVDRNCWAAAGYICDNFDYQDIYNQIDNLLHDYLAKK